MGVSDNNKSNQVCREAIIDLAVEGWRFGRTFSRAIEKIDASEQARFTGQLRWYLKSVEASLQTCGLKLVNVEGQTFDPGVAATPLNIDEFEPEESLLIDQMIEPIIMGENGLVRTGTVMLRKG